MRRRLFSLERVDGQVGRVLGTLQMQLHRCGGPNDGGIDLQGIWTIDSPAIPLVVQCKDTSHCTTGMLREFTGVLSRVHGEGVVNPVGVFVTSMSLRNSMLRESALSGYPLLLVRVSEGEIRSIQPNYSLLRVYPHVEFLFDIERTNLPVIRCNGKIVFGNVEWIVCWR
ncbi:hypothetical protein WA538_002006, partial [Blastocystis sp. DL]